MKYFYILLLAALPCFAQRGPVIGGPISGGSGGGSFNTASDYTVTGLWIFQNDVEITGGLTVDGIDAAGSVTTADIFYGDGSGITNLNAAYLSGTIGSLNYGGSNYFKSGSTLVLGSGASLVSSNDLAIYGSLTFNSIYGNFETVTNAAGANPAFLAVDSIPVPDSTGTNYVINTSLGLWAGGLHATNTVALTNILGSGGRYLPIYPNGAARKIMWPTNWLSTTNGWIASPITIGGNNGTNFVTTLYTSNYANCSGMVNGTNKVFAISSGRWPW